MVITAARPVAVGRSTRSISATMVTEPDIAVLQAKLL